MLRYTLMISLCWVFFACGGESTDRNPYLLVYKTENTAIRFEDNRVFAYHRTANEAFFSDSPVTASTIQKGATEFSLLSPLHGFVSGTFTDLGTKKRGVARDAGSRQYYEMYDLTLYYRDGTSATFSSLLDEHW